MSTRNSISDSDHEGESTHKNDMLASISKPAGALKKGILIGKKQGAGNPGPEESLSETHAST